MKTYERSKVHAYLAIEQEPDMTLVHGPLACRDCWVGCGTEKVFTTQDHQFRVVNDPGYWGSPAPEVLVLGISKGFTQANAFASGNFDEVPFKKCRSRLQQILVSVGVMDEQADINTAMQATERRFGWASLVRCSLSGWNNKSGTFGAGTPDVLPAFKHPEAQLFLHGCMRKHLSPLPASVSLVILLGNDDRYIKVVGSELHRLYGPNYRTLNAVSHLTGSVKWVHVAHPSPGNGHFSNFINDTGESAQGLKRELACSALQGMTELNINESQPVDARASESMENKAINNNYSTPILQAKPQTSKLVPVAQDGTWFGEHLRRNGGFTVGEKGNEQKFASFEEALAFLQKQSTARWRRPNAAGNWGIVAVANWKRSDEVPN